MLLSLDMNECLLETDECDTNANCTNTEGSYYCTCNQGYDGDGFFCSGIKIINQEEFRSNILVIYPVEWSGTREVIFSEG